MDRKFYIAFIIVLFVVGLASRFQSSSSSSVSTSPRPEQHNVADEDLKQDLIENQVPVAHELYNESKNRKNRIVETEPKIETPKSNSNFHHHQQPEPPASSFPLIISDPQKLFYSDADLFSKSEIALMRENEQFRLNPSSNKIEEKEIRERTSLMEIRLQSSTKKDAKILSRHSLIVPVPSLDRIVQGAAKLAELMNCSKFFSFGMYWSLARARCERLAGFILPSGDGNDDSDNKKTSELDCPRSSTTQQVQQQSENHLEVNQQAKQLTSSVSPDILQKYENFQASSSWFFSRKKRAPSTTTWSPILDTQPTSSSSSNTFRSLHDPAFEFLFRLENFCVSPFSNLKGFFGSTDPKQRPSKYRGLDDTRNQFHGDFSFARYISNIEMKSSAPAHFDKRPVYFIPLTRISLGNLGHLSLKMLSAIGNLKVMFGGGHDEEVLFDSSSTSSTNRNDNNNNDKNKEKTVKPLVIFVLDSSIETLDELNKMRPAWRMMFRMLNLPCVQIITPRHTFSFGDSETDYELLKKNEDNWEICFRSGFAFQNSFPLSTVVNGGSSHDEETQQGGDINSPSYAFRIFDRINDQRKSLMDIQRRLFQKCFMIDDIATNNNNNNKNEIVLPKIFFAIRSQYRGIVKFGTMIDQIRKDLMVGPQNGDKTAAPAVASDIVFMEPWRSDRVEYLKELHSSDILIGTHGAAFAESWVMSKNNNNSTTSSSSSSSSSPTMLIQLSERYHEQHCYNRQQQTKKKTSCWFGIFSEYLDADHWVFDVPSRNLENAKWDGRNPFSISLPTLIGVLRKAICRWQFKKFTGVKSGEDDEGGGGAGDNSNDAGKIPQSTIDSFLSKHAECKSINTMWFKKSRFTSKIPVETTLLLSTSSSSSSSTAASFGGSQSLQSTVGSFVSETIFAAIGSKLASTSDGGIDLRIIFNDPNPDIVRQIQKDLKIRLESSSASLWQPFVEYFVKENIRVVQRDKSVVSGAKVSCIREMVNKGAVAGREREECLYLVTE